jgi:hypothetical protein
MFFRGKLDWLREPGRISKDQRKVETNPFTWTKKTFVESNTQAIRDALAYCQAAVQELERMRLIPELDMGRIEELKEKVPRIDVYQEYIGEKPIPDINVNPRMLLPSDSQMDWEIAKINERYKEIMRR